VSVEDRWRVSKGEDLVVSREDVDDSWRSRVVEDSRSTESEYDAATRRQGGSSSSLSTLAGGEGGGGPK
jgi:hypothetical protein